MKRTQRFPGGLLALLLCCLPLNAQTHMEEAQDFQKTAGDRSILYRGEQAASYLSLANGNPYWDNAEFQNGDIVFEGNTYYDVPLNIDANIQRVLVHLANGPFVISHAPALVPAFTMGGRLFAGFGPDGALPEGFYEIIGEGREQVYKQVRKLLSSSLMDVNGDPIGYVDANYRPDIFKYFAIERSYYFRDKDGNFSPLKNLRQLLNRYPDRKKELRKAIKAAGLRTKEFDACCELVLKLTDR